MVRWCEVYGRMEERERKGKVRGRWDFTDEARERVGMYVVGKKELVGEVGRGEGW